MSQEVEPSLLVKREMFIENLTVLIRDSGLPILVTLPIIRDLQDYLAKELASQVAAEKEAYAKAVEESLAKNVDI